jgi:hypothetical protein
MAAKVYFQELVKSELQNWLEVNTKALRPLLRAIADRLGPAIAEEIRRGALKRLGELESDERDDAARVLHECATAIRRMQLARGKDTDEAASDLAEEADALATKIAVQIHPTRRSEPGDSQKEAPF